ncbi:MAG: hypothetical protein KGL42_11860 [Betaproteobacteria bacterium]|nr:hypothetical protein [Betaproteobacteria bacterium]
MATAAETKPIIRLDFEGNPILVQMGDDGSVWYTAKPLCTAIGFTKMTVALDRHVKPGDQRPRGVPTGGGVQQMLHVNEAGMRALVAASHLVAARRFKKWIAAGVIHAAVRAMEAQDGEALGDRLDGMTWSLTPRRRWKHSSAWWRRRCGRGDGAHADISIHGSALRIARWGSICGSGVRSGIVAFRIDRVIAPGVGAGHPQILIAGDRIDRWDVQRRMGSHPGDQPRSRCADRAGACRRWRARLRRRRTPCARRWWRPGRHAFGRQDHRA